MLQLQKKEKVFRRATRVYTFVLLLVVVLGVRGLDRQSLTRTFNAAQHVKL